LQYLEKTSYAAAEDALPLTSRVVARHYLDCSGLEKERVFIIQIVHGDGEADDRFAVDGYYSSAVAALFVAWQFGRAFHLERIQLPVYCFEEWYGLGALFDCYDARVERGSGLERARDGKAEANLVTAEVQALSGEW